jgi:fused signal recognition particle receptor
MLRIFRREKTQNDNQTAQPIESTPALTTPVEAAESEEKLGFFNRLRQGLSRTRKNLTNGLANIVLGKKHIDAELLEEIETQLLLADIGVETSQALIASLTEKVKRKELDDAQVLIPTLVAEMQAMLEPVAKPLQIQAEHHPFVILVVGINGSGKTTTIGKLAKHFQAQGKSVMLAAGDTFRAAAVEQLQIWGERNGIAVVAQQTGSDSASVVFDALQSAKARGVDILLADTAGRLHTQHNLMEELKKVRRVLAKLDASAPHEVLLVLDATIGQNALIQARQFQQAVEVSGIALTKLDGTAKGGIIFSIAAQTGIPIRFIGVGEQIDDLRPFIAKDFVTALFTQEESEESDD